ncbi:hypothetical protein GCM10010994_47310 [Chelatococcus reniformis]|uniref:DUF306 domain-containing protein n=2 Tax=Chelatococcus reniformis TaxID=1494448 RepID=A0A916XMF7_9HYPH|nr:hypothetical protein GCM10010994_47310 [Chelatococcus reniformis]
MATLCLSGLLAVPASAQFRQKGGGNQNAPQTEGIPAKPNDKTFPLGKSWLAVSLNGKPFGKDRPAFILDQQFRARGFAGCNTYSAVAFPLREQGIAVGPLALTRRSCDKDTMASENAFLSALRYSQKWDMVGGQLVVKGPSGEIRFDRSI